MTDKTDEIPTRANHIDLLRAECAREGLAPEQTEERIQAVSFGDLAGGIALTPEPKAEG